MEELRVVFMGTPNFSCGILKSLYDNNYKIVGCVSQMDKPVGRKQILTSPPLKMMAESYNIPVLQPQSIRSEYEAILALKPDLIITCAYGQLIPKAILEYPKFGCINVHASLLPKYRGGAPIHYAIMNGEKEAGVTIMKMVSKMDAGDMLVQKSLQVEITDTTEILFERLMLLGQTLLIDMLPDYIKGIIVPIAQNEEEATFAYNITKQQEYIDFYQDVEVVYNHIRGLISWPVGYIIIDDLKIKLHQVSFQRRATTKVGQVVGLIDDALAIEAMDGLILIFELQVAGKMKQTAKSFYNGYQSKIENKLVRRKSDVNQ